MTTVINFDKKAADALLSRAKIDVMKHKKLVFFSVLVMNMLYKWRTDIPTAATNGRTIFINPVAYAQLTANQRVSRLMHETMHNAFCHLLRVGHRNKRKWNRACDYFINLMLTDAGFERIPTWLWDEKYRGMSAEQIYDVLPDAEESNFDPDLLEPDEPDDPDTPMGQPDIEYAMDKLLVQATMQAQKSAEGVGNIPASVVLYLDHLLNPKLPWDIILNRWFGKYARKGYSWTKPSSRYSDVYMPSRRSPTLDKAAFATDISISVSDNDYKQIVTEVSSVIKKMKPDWIDYIQFSEGITSVTRVKTIKQLRDIEFIGRGGTNVREVFEWAEKNKPKVLVILTDGGFYWPTGEDGQPIKPVCDVVWLIHDNPEWEAEYGKVIHYAINT